ncbi:MAG: triose-phosphate isomerase [Candidatus Peribacteraceae bacterium]|jgi:triosephosphate isomerase|nr:triose-phosphate isomerase [Candidatus Peribacteraceae bacterium]|tara:strand:+ start:1576 stop:2310 length:735 start_codon:yes stop_codon:yes gene_type:complete
MDRKLLIAANWKMNPVPDGAFEQDSPYKTHSAVDVYVFPTFLDLPASIESKIITGAQFGRAEETGAFTGDVSMQMIKEAGCIAVLCGHSDRRAFHGESNEDVAAQAIAALEAELHPIVCFGETEEERDSGKAENVIKAQLKPLPTESDIILAYEPIWAISRGDPNKPAATSEDAQEMHAFIRSQLPEDKRESTRILYGGSMKSENAQELLTQPDIDGGLVGGASLKPDDFRKIVETAIKLTTNN